LCSIWRPPQRIRRKHVLGSFREIGRIGADRVGASTPSTGFQRLVNRDFPPCHEMGGFMIAGQVLLTGAAHYGGFFGHTGRWARSSRTPFSSPHEGRGKVSWVWMLRSAWLGGAGCSRADQLARYVCGSAVVHNGAFRPVIVPAPSPTRDAPLPWSRRRRLIPICLRDRLEGAAPGRARHFRADELGFRNAHAVGTAIAKPNAALT
jgi:hypothetical protein